MKYSVMLIVYFLMFLIEAPASPRLKGWPEKFEASDNCDGEDEMKGLEAWRCASASAEGGSARFQWEDCRYKLLGKLALSCGQRKVKEVGQFLFCSEGGRTSCCFLEEKCGGSTGGLRRVRRETKKRRMRPRRGRKRKKRPHVWNYIVYS